METKETIYYFFKKINKSNITLSCLIV